MHPFALLAAAAVALLIYSNFVFYYRPPVPDSETLETHSIDEFERRRNENYPFFVIGLPTVPRHALATRTDMLEAGKRHVIPPEPRCRRVLFAEPLMNARGGVVRVVLALDRRAKIKVGLPAGYSLFLPPSWRAQMVVPAHMVCKLHSSDSVGSLCLRLPKLLGPALEQGEAMAHSFLGDVLATLDTPPERRQWLSLREGVPSRIPNKPASCTPLTPLGPSLRREPTPAPSRKEDASHGHQRTSEASCHADRPSLSGGDISESTGTTIQRELRTEGTRPTKFLGESQR